MNVLLCIGYDGTDFLGYQKQHVGRTVQGVLDTVLSQHFNCAISTHVAGRTDSGVHAVKQYLNFHIDESVVPISKLSYVLNAQLPHDVRVYWSQEVPKDFHARYSAVSRSYYYQLYEGEVVPPTLSRYCKQVPRNLDWHRIQDDLHEFLGTHDFTSFSSHNPQITNYVRTLSRAEVEYFDEHIKRIHFTATGFLWKMIRTMVGTIIERAIILHTKKEAPPLMTISDMLKIEDRSYTGKTTEARGLFLYEVLYANEYDIKRDLTTGKSPSEHR